MIFPTHAALRTRLSGESNQRRFAPPCIASIRRKKKWWSGAFFTIRPSRPSQRKWTSLR